MQWMPVVVLITVLGLARAGEAPPVAPTLDDAHRYFASLVAKNAVAALYQAFRNGDFLGHVSYPVRSYKGEICHSEIMLANGIRIDIDWSVVNRSQASDSQLGIWRNPAVQYESFRLLNIEGGVVAGPANNIPKLNLAIADELSRNRLLKATLLLSSTCRSDSKFD